MLTGDTAGHVMQTVLKTDAVLARMCLLLTISGMFSRQRRTHCDVRVARTSHVSARGGVILAAYVRRT